MIYIFKNTDKSEKLMIVFESYKVEFGGHRLDRRKLNSKMAVEKSEKFRHWKCSETLY